MDKTYEEAEQDFLEHKERLKLKLLPGGKIGPPWSDWLSELPVDTVFLADYQETAGSRTMFLPKWQISNKSRLAVELWDTEQNKRMWVIPFNFCQDFRLYEILYRGKEEKEVDE